MGVNCEKCKVGYYRPKGVNQDDPKPCKACDCDALGSTGECISNDEELEEGEARTRFFIWYSHSRVDSLNVSVNLLRSRSRDNADARKGLGGAGARSVRWVSGITQIVNPAPATWLELSMPSAKETVHAR